MQRNWIFGKTRDDGRVGLFSPEFRQPLQQRGFYYLRLFGLYSLILWISMSLFFGCMYKMSEHAQHIVIDVVNLDRGPAGQTITDIVMHAQSQHTVTPILRLQRRHVADSASVDSVVENVRLHGWGAIVINPGLSERLDAAFNNSAGYSSEAALTVLFSSGRDALAYSRYVQPGLSNLANYAAKRFAVQQLQTTLQVPTSISVLVNPIGYTMVDVAPYTFGISQIAPAYAIFVSLTCTLASQVLVKLSSEELYEFANHHHLTVLFHCMMLLWSVTLSIYSTLAFVAFRGPGYNVQRLGLPFTTGRFFSIFATYAVTIFVTSQWIFFWITLLPPDLVPFAFAITLVLSVVSSLVSLELIPGGLRWIIIVPGHNSAMLFRYIVSGAYPHLGTNIGILLSEMVGMYIFNSVAIMVRQYWLISGFADTAGWYKTSIFYKPHKHRMPESADYTSTPSSERSLPELGFHIADESQTPERMHFTLYGQ